MKLKSALRLFGLVGLLALNFAIPAKAGEFTGTCWTCDVCSISGGGTVACCPEVSEGFNSCVPSGDGCIVSPKHCTEG